MANGLKDAIVGVVTKAKRAVKKALTIQKDTLYDYTDKASREETIAYLLLYADGQRQDQMTIWRMCDDYYNNKHQSQLELQAYCQKKNIPWIPAIIPDPQIHVDSQLNVDMPSFEFSGRDEDMDSQKAKVRQYVCQYVLDQNEMLMKVIRNQKRLGKFGNEIWKIGYDYNVDRPGGIHGDIFVHDIDITNFIPDPVAVDMDDAEYHDYPYRLHRVKAARIFKKELLTLGIKDITEIGTGTPVTTQLFSTDNYDYEHDTVQIVEHWFRQPQDGSEKYTYEVEGKEVTETVEWEAGDIACSILINTTEIKYIPKYWMKTSKQNKMYPFAMGCKIPVENKFWDRSDIEAMKDLVDAEDRELAITLLNDTFMANDIIIMDDNAMADGSQPINEPAAIWLKKPGSPKPERLGGLGNLNGGLKDTINFIRDIIKQVTGNFDVNMGDAPPGNVRTLGGLVQLKEQGNSRQNKKKAGTTAMWERILKLIDYTAIEFYDDNRLIFIGAEKSDKTEPTQGQDGTTTQKPVPVQFKYNSDYLKVYDDQTNQYYYPVVDAKINVGDGIKNSPAMTIQATEDLMAKTINPTNYKVAESLVDQLNLPNRKEIKDAWDTLYSNPQPQQDKPSISIAYKDTGLPPTPEQVQILALAGIKVQPQQSQQQGQGIDVNAILDQLTPEERQHLQENPQLLDNLMGGGGQNAMPVQP